MFSSEESEWIVDNPEINEDVIDRRQDTYGESSKSNSPEHSTEKDQKSKKKRINDKLVKTADEGKGLSSSSEENEEANHSKVGQKVEKISKPPTLDLNTNMKSQTLRRQSFMPLPPAKKDRVQYTREYDSRNIQKMDPTIRLGQIISVGSAKNTKILVDENGVHAAEIEDLLDEEMSEGDMDHEIDHLKKNVCLNI